MCMANRKKENQTALPFPNKNWLSAHGFRGFVSSFAKRYVQNEGVTTLSSFFQMVKKLGR